MNCQHISPTPSPLSELLDAARIRVQVIAPNQAISKLDQWLVLDVREPAETLHGYLPFAVHVPRGLLEFKATENTCFERSRPILVYSDHGRRSLLASLTLLQLGFTDVFSLAGGMTEWIAMDLPLE